MFTGIVETTGQVLEISQTACGQRLTVDVSGLSGALRDGESLAVDGVCLTAVGATSRICAFEVMAETLRRTNLSELRVGRCVNLERSMTAASRFDGHWVQGHVDAVGAVETITADEADWCVWFRHDGGAEPYVVPKGSIAVNGVSLTIAEVEHERFSVALIPTTLGRTNLGQLAVGDRVNLETDVLARTVFHQLKVLLNAGDGYDLFSRAQEHMTG